MMPKIWDGIKKETEKPMPLLHISERMHIEVVTPKGERIACISNEDGYSAGARGAIGSNGYSIEWAEWNNDGSFKKIK